MNDITKVANEAYKMALEAYKSAKMKVLGLQLQLMSMDSAIEVKRNMLIAKDEFTVLKNEMQRKAYLSDNLASDEKLRTPIEIEILKTSASLDVLGKDLTFFKDTFRASYMPSDKE